MPRPSRVLALLLAFALVFGNAVPAFAAAAPASMSSPVTLVNEGFESTSSPTYPVIEPYYPIFQSTGWWGPIGFIRHSGSKALWVTGSTTPTVWPSNYPIGSGGLATFDLSQLQDYYSAKLSFWYSMPSLGDDDSDAFILRWFDQADPIGALRYHGLGYFPKTSVGGWRFSGEWDLNTPGTANLSRRPGKVVFQWYDAEEAYGQSHLSGEGPTIDDVSITGYKYGPIRSLTATRSGNNIVLSWQKPYRAVGSTVEDTRAIGYRVWRSLASAPNDWTELTTTRVTTLSFTDTTAPAGALAYYFVQAWDPSPGTAYGDPSGSHADVDMTPPTTTIQNVPSGWVKTNVSFSLTATDEPGNTIRTMYRVNGSGWTTYATPVTLSAQGTNTVDYYSVDQAGNAETVKTAYARIDRTPPSTTASVAAVPGSSVITLHPGDSHSGVANTYWTLDGGAPQAGTTIVVGGMGTTHLVTWYSVDKAGNVEGTNSRSITVGTDDVQGGTRFDTAVQSVERAFPTGASTVIVAWGGNFPDALGASALAGAYDAPLLLTETGYVPESVKDEITKLGATRAIIIGSEKVVSPAVVTDLRSKLTGAKTVERIAGDGRYDTARQVAEKVAQVAGARSDVFLAVGDNFPDALAASPAAFAKKWPIVLTTPTELSPQAISAITNLQPARVHILGGTGAVRQGVEDTLRQLFPSITVDRWKGDDRYFTAVDIANKSGLSWQGIALATGQNFPDALAGGVMQGKLGGVVLLTQTAVLSPATESAIVAHKPQIAVVRYLGSGSAVGTAVRARVSQILQ